MGHHHQFFDFSDISNAEGDSGASEIHRTSSRGIDRRINISTDSHRRTSIDKTTPTTRGKLVTKVKLDMSDTNKHGEEISADTYARLLIHQFKLE